MAKRSSFTKATGDAICARLAEGQSLREICRDKGMPSQSMVFRWLADDETFREQYAHAREAQADRFLDEIVEIADDGSNDWMDRKLGNGETITVPDHEHISRSKLRVDARKWLMSKMAPKKYGDKLDVEHAGPGGGPVVFKTVYEQPKG